MSEAPTGDHGLLPRSTVRLRPDPAVAALIQLDDGRYLMQCRDSKPGIFYPGHWGCFGGAIEAGESDLQALYRELDEELRLPAEAATVSYFTTFDFDWSFAGLGVLKRVYFEVRIAAKLLSALTLGEGREMRSMTYDELLLQSRLVPYDAFALWMHVNRGRIGH